MNSELQTCGHLYIIYIDYYSCGGGGVYSDRKVSSYICHNSIRDMTTRYVPYYTTTVALQCIKGQH